MDMVFKQRSELDCKIVTIPNWLAGTDRPEAVEVAEISLMAVESTLQVAAEGVAISHLAEVRSNKILSIQLAWCICIVNAL